MDITNTEISSRLMGTVPSYRRLEPVWKINEPESRGSVESIRFDFKKASASRGEHSRSSIHPAACYVVFRRALKEEDDAEVEETEAKENRAYNHDE